MTRSSQIACLMYHEVTEHPITTGFQRVGSHRYALSPQAFVQHLNRFENADLVPAMVGDVDLAKSGRHLLLTFDDGGKSALVAAEQLARRGWRGHFFIVTSRIGESTFLDKAGIRAIRDLGHLVGSHSHTHPDIFRDLSRQGMIDEWMMSTRILEDLLGERCIAASVPGGDISLPVLESAGEAGFRYLFTSEPWTRPRRVGDCWILGRLCVKAAMSPDAVEDLAQFRGWWLARLERGLKGLARSGMNPLYRYYVERSTLPLPPASAPPA